MMPTTSYGSLIWLASVNTTTSKFGCLGAYEAVPMRSTELLTHPTKNKAAKIRRRLSFIRFLNFNRENKGRSTCLGSDRYFYRRSTDPSMTDQRYHDSSGHDPD